MTQDRTTLDIARDILVAYLGANSVEADQLPGLMDQVHQKVIAMQSAAVKVPGYATPAPVAVTAETPVSVEEAQEVVEASAEQAPLVDVINGEGNIPPRPDKPIIANEDLETGDYIKDSVKHDYIVCLEDGSHRSMLKRYLRTHYNLTPEQYKARWNLPPSYPMVAPAYSAQKAFEAKKTGLGSPDHKAGRAMKVNEAARAAPAPAEAAADAKPTRKRIQGTLKPNYDKVAEKRGVRV